MISSPSFLSKDKRKSNGTCEEEPMNKNNSSDKNENKNKNKNKNENKLINENKNY
jgi:hypothetical protein